jgi:hypothetical protein
MREFVFVPPARAPSRHAPVLTVDSHVQPVIDTNDDDDVDDNDGDDDGAVTVHRVETGVLGATSQHAHTHARASPWRRRRVQRDDGDDEHNDNTDSVGEHDDANDDDVEVLRVVKPADASAPSRITAADATTTASSLPLRVNSDTSASPSRTNMVTHTDTTSPSPRASGLAATAALAVALSAQRRAIVREGSHATLYCCTHTM